MNQLSQHERPADTTTEGDHLRRAPEVRIDLQTCRTPLELLGQLQRIDPDIQRRMVACALRAAPPEVERSYAEEMEQARISVERMLDHDPTLPPAPEPRRDTREEWARLIDWCKQADALLRRAERLARLETFSAPPAPSRPAPVADLLGSLIDVFCSARCLASCASEYRESFPEGKPWPGVPAEYGAWQAKCRARIEADGEAWTQEREAELRELHAEIRLQTERWEAAGPHLDQDADKLRVALDAGIARVPAVRSYLRGIVELPAAWTTGLLTALRALRGNLAGRPALEPWTFTLRGMEEHVRCVERAIDLLVNADIAEPVGGDVQTAAPAEATRLRRVATDFAKLAATPSGRRTVRGSLERFIALMAEHQDRWNEHWRQARARAVEVLRGGRLREPTRGRPAEDYLVQDVRAPRDVFIKGVREPREDTPEAERREIARCERLLADAVLDRLGEPPTCAADLASEATEIVSGSVRVWIDSPPPPKSPVRMTASERGGLSDQDRLALNIVSLVGLMLAQEVGDHPAPDLSFGWPLTDYAPGDPETAEVMFAHAACYLHEQARDHPAEATPAGERLRGAAPSTVAGRTTRWTTARARDAALRYLRSNVFPGVRALAELIGCPVSTLDKAINSDPTLLARKKAYLRDRGRTGVRGAAAGDALEAVEGGLDATDELSRADELLERLIDEGPPGARDRRHEVLSANRAHLREMLAGAIRDDDPDALRSAQEAIQELLGGSVHERSRGQNRR